MAKPKVVDTFPAMIDLEEGEYSWCACGSCSNQPYSEPAGCGSEFKAVSFSVDKAKRYKLCLCKHTEKAPYCDGAHCRL